ncbi:hypothetical protein FALBO_12776 [Fusarium albosuccineum]|uniref:Uncharacterized protein n=1 Tax=Fusarium albosuccineum TaxID=1237068 RepID=A0A8H4PGW5_9HYPO|nr:hypothetical protein FALBO_12776 [Fusarium albosuccineum]
MTKTTFALKKRIDPSSPPTRFHEAAKLCSKMAEVWVTELSIYENAQIVFTASTAGNLGVHFLSTRTLLPTIQGNMMVYLVWKREDSQFGPGTVTHDPGRAHCPGLHEHHTGMLHFRICLTGNNFTQRPASTESQPTPDANLQLMQNSQLVQALTTNLVILSYPETKLERYVAHQRWPLLRPFVHRPNIYPPALFNSVSPREPRPAEQQPGGILFPVSGMGGARRCSVAESKAAAIVIEALRLSERFVFGCADRCQCRAVQDSQRSQRFGTSLYRQNSTAGDHYDRGLGNSLADDYRGFSARLGYCAELPPLTKLILCVMIQCPSVMLFGVIADLFSFNWTSNSKVIEFLIAILYQDLIPTAGIAHPGHGSTRPPLPIYCYRTRPGVSVHRALTLRDFTHG